jgi:hypothetical protein
MLVPQLGVDVDHNPTRKRGILPEYRPSLTVRLGFRGFFNRGYLQVVALGWLKQISGTFLTSHTIFTLPKQSLGRGSPR